MQVPAPTDDYKEEEDHVFGGINLLARSLDNLDERGLVLSLSAFAEDALGSLLKAFMVPSEATAQLLEGFNAPLGTFSARTKAAYALGLITKDQFQDLERLRKIRNEYAHTWRPLSLSQPKIAALVKAMEFSRLDERCPETLSDKVRTTMSCVLAELRSAAHQILEQGAQAQLTGNHLVAGFAGVTFEAQLQKAHKHFADIQQRHNGKDGEIKKFYITQLRRLLLRLGVVRRPETSAQELELQTFQEEVQKALVQAEANK